RTWQPRPRLSVDAGSLSDGRKNAEARTARGTNRRPGGTANEALDVWPAVVFTVWVSPERVTVQSAPEGPENSVTLSRRAPAGAVSSSACPFPRVQKTPPSG